MIIVYNCGRCKKKNSPEKTVKFFMPQLLLFRGVFELLFTAHLGGTYIFLYNSAYFFPSILPLANVILPMAGGSENIYVLFCCFSDDIVEFIAIIDLSQCHIILLLLSSSQSPCPSILLYVLYGVLAGWLAG